MKLFKTAVFCFVIMIFFNLKIYGLDQKLLNFQGRILDNNNQPINGLKAMTFSIYMSATSGTAVIAEVTTVNLIDGYYNFYFGTTMELAFLDFSKDMWLEIKLGNDAPFPRIPFTNVPYSFYSLRSEKSDSSTIAETVEKVDLSKVNLKGKMPEQNLPDHIIYSNKPVHFYGPVVFEQGVQIKGNLNIGRSLSTSSITEKDEPQRIDNGLSCDFPAGFLAAFTDLAPKSGWKYTGLSEIKQSSNIELTIYWFVKE